MRHQPGTEMVADVGTKPLTAIKLKEHKLRLGMEVREKEKLVNQPSTRREVEAGETHTEGRLSGISMDGADLHDPGGPHHGRDPVNLEVVGYEEESGA